MSEGQMVGGTEVEIWIHTDGDVWTRQSLNTDTLILLQSSNFDTREACCGSLERYCRLSSMSINSRQIKIESPDSVSTPLVSLPYTCQKRGCYSLRSEYMKEEEVANIRIVLVMSTDKAR